MGIAKSFLFSKMQCLRCANPASLRCQWRCGYALCAECSTSETHRCRLAGRGEYAPHNAAYNKQLFDQFYDENRGDKLYPTKNYNINIEQLNAWAAAVNRSNCPEEVIALANTFALNLTHIGFNYFYMKLNQVAHDVRAKIEALKPNKVYALINMNYRKSPTWVALLIWDVLRDLVTGVVTDPRHIPLEEFEQPLAIIHMDDMSYSGTQMGDTVDLGVGLYDDAKTHYYVLVPFMGTGAKRHLVRVWKHLKFSTYTTEMATLNTFLTWGGYDSLKVLKKLDEPVWHRLYPIRLPHNLIYFDHKLADALSVPTKMFAALYVADAQGKVLETFHPIRGCEDNVYKTDTGKVLTPGTSVNDWEQASACPVSFYKGINYTFNGVSLESSIEPLMDILNKLQPM
jgi:hypothetical protein